MTGGDWVAALVGTTIAVRLLMFPLAVSGARNTVGITNLMPETVKIQERMNAAKERGDTTEQMSEYGKLQKVYKREGVSPFAGIRVAVGQMFIFVPMFFACRSLGNAAVPSMLDGGVAWFPNLCAADPLYILPTMSAVSMLLLIEGGAADGMNMSPQMRWFFRGMSGLTFFVTMNFPSIVVLYFATSNTFSLLQSLVLRLPATRSIFNIPQKIDHGVKPPEAPGLVSSFKNIKKKFDEQEASLKKGQNLEHTDIREQALQNLTKSKERRRNRVQKRDA